MRLVYPKKLSLCQLIIMVPPIGNLWRLTCAILKTHKSYSIYNLSKPSGNNLMGSIAIYQAVDFIPIF